MLTLIQAFGQEGQIIIGKAYNARQDSTSDKVYISIENDLDVPLRDIRVTFDKQPILTIQKLRRNSKKCYSFLKRELKGDNVFILQYEMLTDTLRGTDEISYIIHELERSGQGQPLTDKEKRNTQKKEYKKEDDYFMSNKCNYRQHKL